MEARAICRKRAPRLPVCKAPIQPPELRAVALAVAGRAGGFFVELHSQARAVRRQQVAVLEGDLDGEDVRKHAAGDAGQLLDPEVAGGQIQVEAGGRRDRPERIVRRELDVVGLAPARDLPGLGDPAADAEVDPAVLDQVLLHQLAEIPLRGELLAGGERNRYVPGELMERV